MSEKKKALLVTTISGFVPQFEMNNVKILQDMGYEVHYAANYNTPVYTDNNDRLNGTGIVRHQVDFIRSPFRLIKNIKAYRQLKEVMKKDQYDLVHCHTPMGGVIGRIAAKQAEIPYIIYTAHGFHFFKGAPLINWLFFYPVERMLARVTDVLITINKEDYKIAQKFHMHNKGLIKLTPGVGIDTEIKKTELTENLKSSLGIDNESYIVTSVGELTKRKNHQVIVKAMEIVVKERPDIVYLICGSGELEYSLMRLVDKLNLKKNVKFLGYRTDVEEILSISDCFIFPSLQEGLPVAILEAMVSGLPIICSDIRGNRDLIKDGESGYVIEHQSIKKYAECIIKIFSDTKNAKYFGNYNKARVKKYDRRVVEQIMMEVYMKNLRY
ncbi:glycosyltransferase family 4 protein [Anaerosporobacter sp.]